MEEDRSRPRQSLPVNLLLSLVVMGFCLAAAEGLTRWFERPPRPRLPENYTFNWEMDWGEDFYVLKFPSTGWPRRGVQPRRRARPAPSSGSILWRSRKGLVASSVTATSTCAPSPLGRWERWSRGRDPRCPRSSPPSATPIPPCA